MTIYEIWEKLNSVYGKYGYIHFTDDMENIFDDSSMLEFETVDYDSNVHYFEIWQEIIDSHHGIYIPKIFNDFMGWEKGISSEDVEILNNPDHEFYWEVWEMVLNNAEFEHKESGLIWNLSQEGDLFAVHYFTSEGIENLMKGEEFKK